MAVTLRLVADQLVTCTDPDLASATGALLHALLAETPRGCDIAAIVPAGDQHLTSTYPGVREVQVAPLQRRELAATWQLGIAGTIGGGLIHSPTLMAPLVRHDRANSASQTVVTLWDVDAWEASHTLSKPAVMWHRSMLKRAVKYADAIVVPSFALAERVNEIHNFGERIRVIAGAVPQGFAVPSDSEARLRDLNLPESFLVVPLAGVDDPDTALRAAAAAAGDERCVVLLGGAEATRSRVSESLNAAGLAEGAVRILGELETADRATVMARAEAVLFCATGSAWPWRAIEAMHLGIPIVAVDSGMHREVIGDGGAVVAADQLADALVRAIGDDAERMRILSSDRGRSYSWQSAAEQVWQLHAEL